jgi:hypothetical protein
MGRDEYRRFNCPKFKISIEITYRYDTETNKLVCIECPMKNSKRCDASIYPNDTCIIFLPYPELNKPGPHLS